MFIIFTCYPFIMVLVQIATLFQHAENPFDKPKMIVTRMIITVLSLPFYIMGMYICFNLYKSIKIAFSGAPDVAHENRRPMNGSRNNQNESNELANQNTQVNPELNNYNANVFAGKGVVL